ncbi:MAG: hypothetical protein WD872_04145 [Pirellulaceae bacterium]
MNHSLPSVTRLGFRLVCAAWIALPAFGAQGAENEAAQPAPPEWSEGNRIVVQAARRVQDESALSADLRYRIDAFGHELAGQGSYQQLGKGPEKLLRMELKVQVADQAITRQEICGPSYYYIRCESPFAPTSLGRVNLRALRLGIARAPAHIAGNPAEAWILLGGLPKLLESLFQNFDFSPPREDELQFASADGQGVERLPVIILTGRWKKDSLAALRNTGKGPSKERAEQLPDAVEIVLGRADQVLPLFPYRITYLQTEPGEKSEQGRGGESSRPLLSLELFNVHRKGNLDPRDFDYQPGTQEFADLTQAYLQRLGLAIKQR